MREEAVAAAGTASQRSNDHRNAGRKRQWVSVVSVGVGPADERMERECAPHVDEAAGRAWPALPWLGRRVLRSVFVSTVLILVRVFPEEYEKRGDPDVLRKRVSSQQLHLQ